MRAVPWVAIVSVVILVSANSGRAGSFRADDRGLTHAEELIRAAKPAEAMKILERLQKLASTDERVPFLLAQCEWNIWLADRERDSHLETARAHITRALLLKSPFPACSFVSGRIEMDAGDYEAAIGGFRQALAGRYRRRATQQHLAFALYYRGLDLAKVVETGIDRALVAAGVFEEASQRFEALAGDTRFLPDDRARFREHWTLARSNLALMHLRSRNFPAAEKMLLELIGLEPRNHLHQYNLGLLYDRKHQYKEAVAHYQRALDLGQESGFAGSHLPLARILSKQGKREVAENHFERYLEKFPTSWEGLHERGLHNFRNKDFEKAIADYRKCLELDPTAHIAMKSLSDALARSGDQEEAGKWAEKHRAADREVNRERLPGKDDKPGNGK